ncbi:flavodoxin family protein [Clostridium neuense]|uniref:Flavodoxin family protein n=1 Tax=Clostridium neuense TaxID=1728934 RepID=A0ABW8TBY1_9CLOT
MDDTKILVVFFSKTGNTKQVAESISKSFNCDIEEIREKTNRKGIFKTIIEIKDAILGNETTICNTQKDPSEYDVVIIGTPVWASHITPAIRSYVSKNKDKIKCTAFFNTHGTDKPKEFKVFKDLEKIIPKKPKALMDISKAELKNGDYKEKIEIFRADLIEYIK